MPKRKYSKSQRKHIRKEKSRIRKEFLSSKKQEEEIKKLFDKVSGRLHIHPTVQRSEKKTEKKKPAAKSQDKPKAVAKKPIESKIKK